MALQFNFGPREGSSMASGVNAEVRVYRTNDGELVRENDPRGAFLAYGVGDVVAAGEVDAYHEILDGKRSGHEVPGLMHDRLATDIADAGRLKGSDPAGPAAEVADAVLDSAAEQVDADRIPAPAPVLSVPPSEVVRQHVAGKDDDRPVTDVPLYRTEDGRLVAEGDPAGTTVAYAKGDRVDEADQEAHADIAKAAKAAKRTTSKAAARPADKAADKPADK